MGSGQLDDSRLARRRAARHAVMPLPKLENDDAAVRSLKEYRNALKALGGLGGLAVGAASAQNEEDPTSRGLGL
eukprot:4412590-Prymnesium_polylepis.1